VGQQPIHIVDGPGARQQSVPGGTEAPRSPPRPGRSRIRPLSCLRAPHVEHVAGKHPPQRQLQARARVRLAVQLPEDAWQQPQSQIVLSVLQGLEDVHKAGARKRLVPHAAERAAVDRLRREAAGGCCGRVALEGVERGGKGGRKGGGGGGALLGGDGGVLGGGFGVGGDGLAEDVEPLVGGDYARAVFVVWMGGG